MAPLAAVILVAASCSGHPHAATPACALRQGAGPSERTGEHTLVLELDGCTARHLQHVELRGTRHDALPFAFAPEGGVSGTTVTLDKYRCDIRYADRARYVRLSFASGRHASLDLGGPSIIDFCPAEAPSSIVHVYLGGVRPPATWQEVLRNARDGRLGRIWPCGALRAALAHLPPSSPVYSTLPVLLSTAASHACDAAIAGVPTRAPRAAALETFGTPSLRGARCLLWRWPSGSGSIDGIRVCFDRGRAAKVQTAVHG